MRFREAVLDLGYFFLTLFLVTYGLVLLVRGYLVGGASKLADSTEGRS